MRGGEDGRVVVGVNGVGGLASHIVPGVGTTNCS